MIINLTRQIGRYWVDTVVHLPQARKWSHNSKQTKHSCYAVMPITVSKSKLLGSMHRLTATSECRTIVFLVHPNPPKMFFSSCVQDWPLDKILRAVSEWHANITRSYSSVCPCEVVNVTLHRPFTYFEDKDSTGEESRSAPGGSLDVTRVTYLMLLE
jgi:hypothetical protein